MKIYSWKYRILYLVRETPIETYRNVALFGFVACVGAYVFGWIHSQYKIRTSPYCEKAFNHVLEQKALLELLGEPVKVGYVRLNGKKDLEDNHVKLLMPLKGTITEGFLSFEADKKNDEWVYRWMEFEFHDKAGGKLRLIKESETLKDSEVQRP